MDVELTWLFLYAIFGAIIGSFLTVCAHRIPLKESICTPVRSYCTACEQQIQWHHKIPVLSWLALGGKCAHCKAQISMKYPMIEVLTAVVSVLSFSLYGLSPTGFLVFAVSCLLIVCSFTDIEHMIIPNAITYPSILIATALAALNHLTHIFDYPVVPSMLGSFWGLLVGAGFLFIVGKSYSVVKGKDGLGWGDIKQLAYLGILFGPLCALFTIFVGSMLGSVYGLVRAVIIPGSFGKYFAFGPFLSLATLMYFFYGKQVVRFWLG